MKVKYTGPIDEVNIREFDLTVQRNHEIEVPEAIGKKLVQQDDWEEVGKPKAQQKDPPAKADKGG